MIPNSSMSAMLPKITSPGNSRLYWWLYATLLVMPVLTFLGIPVVQYPCSHEAWSTTTHPYIYMQHLGPSQFAACGCCLLHSWFKQATKGSHICKCKYAYIYIVHNIYILCTIYIYKYTLYVNMIVPSSKALILWFCPNASHPVLI